MHNNILKIHGTCVMQTPLLNFYKQFIQHLLV